ncbi:MAG: hypothetical protein ACI39R_03130 [Lachnospiraceae bacterium]
MSGRIPKDMIRELDMVAKKGRTRKEIITISLEFVLENMDILGK